RKPGEHLDQRRRRQPEFVLQQQRPRTLAGERAHAHLLDQGQVRFRLFELRRLQFDVHEPMFPTRSKIGVYINTTMAPTTMPMTVISNGSNRREKVSTCRSRSASRKPASLSLISASAPLRSPTRSRLSAIGGIMLLPIRASLSGRPARSRSIATVSSSARTGSRMP